MTVFRPLTSLSTYRGWMWLVLGGAMLMPYMMAAEVMRMLVIGESDFGSTLITAQLPAFVAMLPVIAVTALVLPVRLLSAIPARSLLGVAIPVAASIRDWDRRARDAAWFTLHLGLGGLVSGITLAVIPFAGFITVLPLVSSRNELIGKYFTVHWEAWWGLVLGPLMLLALVYLAWFTTWLVRWLAPRLLGATAAEKLAETRARAANLAARNRIARELHDSVGHALSVVTVQSAAAGRVIDSNPEFARRAMSSIEETARRALEELDTVLGILREDGPADTEPARGLDALSALVASSGIDASVEVDADLAALPPLVSREGYRIVQESLTNALRYGPDRTATVRITTTHNGLRVRVTNPIAPSAAPPREGRGIIGMRERVTVLGGTLSAGPRDGRWVVTAELPIGQADAAAS
ncbi:sensor histidine kinase [Stackebrandtia nassauensis]|uniref:histidine kinase n=1 Tax=Stackebrandtia nassauensis (strain DSM 44728 / CIP 108903 / NRRL B-16338 / NBRC 102104 / LLR-40K-21) TaxID=446470 RepID=D3Q4X0_STANL|nr:histidine kinase [Stackebrandtia nassauensis]ADD42150.1 histidine kinase [Stackebrandtia nassauensis DSM 44728]